ncbi:MAG: hypothetical protein AAFO75_12870 [Pseudomonadota bacterium]
MIEHLYKPFLLISDRDLYLIISVCCICAILLREIIQSVLVSMVLVAPFIAGSILTLHAFRKNSWLVDAGDDIQIVAASAAGVTITFILIAFIFDFLLGLTDMQVKWMLRRRLKK